jgi:Flp pilus assembly protein TadB
LTIAVILVLAVLWIAVLVPPILRARGQQSRSDSVGDFHHKLSSLGHANGHRARPSRVSSTRPIFVPRGAGPATMSATQKRRRDVLFVLLAVVAATFLLAVVTRSMPFIALQILADVVLVGYVYLLIQYKNRTQEQRSKVRYLGAAYREPTPYLNARYVPASREQNGPRLVPLRQTVSS